MRLKVLSLVGSAVLVATVGCSSTNDPPPYEGSTDSTVEPVTPELPRALGWGGALTVPLDELETARIDLDSPDWITLEENALWVRLDNGTIVQVDPEAATVTTEVRAAGSGQFSACQGFGSSAGAIWSCSPWGPLQRVDATTGRTVEQLEIEMSSGQGHLVVADSQLWVLAPDGNSVVPIDLETNEVGEPIELAAACTDLAATDSILWAACPWDDQVLAVDVTTGQVTQRIQIDEPRQIAAGDDLWVSFAGGVGQIDPAELTVTAVYDMGEGNPTGLAVGNGGVWVRNEGGPFLIGIDPRAREIFAVITARDLPSGGNSIDVDGEIWATAFDDATLVRLDPPRR